MPCPLNSRLTKLVRVPTPEWLFCINTWFPYNSNQSSLFTVYFLNYIHKFSIESTMGYGKVAKYQLVSLGVVA